MSETKSETLINFQQPYDYKNSTFVKNLNQKFSQIKDKRIILFMKHLFLRRVVNAFQISIIIASTVITFFESLQNNISLNENQIKILAIFLSTYIAISTAVYKFIKIDDRKEEIYKVLQTFNDIENTIMNKIEQVKLLQDKFSDEMKLELKSPYIMNHKYNHIHSDESDNGEELNQPVLRQPIDIQIRLLKIMKRLIAIIVMKRVLQKSEIIILMFIYYY